MANGVFDQYDIYDVEEFVGTYVDDFITGSLVTKFKEDGVTLIRTGSRGRVFSKNSARAQSAPSSSPSSYEVLINNSKAFREQPWFERVGTPRFVSHSDVVERYYDSMTPDIQECNRADGATIFVTDPNDANGGIIGNAGSVLSGAAGIGFMILNVPPGGGLDLTGLRNVTNLNWNRSFPFEPRYSSAARRVVPLTKMITKTQVNRTLVPSLAFSSTTISPMTLDSFYVCTILPGYLTIYGDVRLGTTDASSGRVLSGSATRDDLTKIVYGFGSSNTIQFVDGGPFGGMSNFVETRNQETTMNPAGQYYETFAIGPIIRGWKYGLVSGLSTFTKSYFRRDRYGQFRDMLEQRQYTKFYVSNENTTVQGVRPGVTTSPISIKFYNTSGSITQPYNTTSQNVSVEATSSFPYFDGIAVNR